MDKENTARSKSKKFAIRIVNLYKYLCEEKREYVLSNNYCVVVRVLGLIWQSPNMQ